MCGCEPPALTCKRPSNLQLEGRREWIQRIFGDSSMPNESGGPQVRHQFDFQVISVEAYGRVVTFETLPLISLVV